MHNSGMFAAWLSAIFCYWRKGWDTFRQHWAGLFGVEGKSVGVWVSDEERWKACSWVLRRGRWGSCSLYSKPCDLHFWKVQMWRVSALPVFHELRQWLLWDKPRSQGQLDHLVLQPLHQECTRLRSQIWEALVFKAELCSFHFPKFLLHHSSFFFGAHYNLSWSWLYCKIESRFSSWPFFFVLICSSFQVVFLSC